MIRKLGIVVLVVLGFGFLLSCVVRESERGVIFAQSIVAVTGDTYLRANEATSNKSGGTTMRCGDGHRPLLYFDVSAVPEGSAIISASLGVLCVSATGSPGSLGVVAYNISRTNLITETTWNSATLLTAWGTAGCDDTASDRAAIGEYTATLTEAGCAANTYYTWVVTSLVDAWVQGAIDNKGVLLIVESPPAASYYTLVASEYDGVDPQLYLDYATPTPTVTPTPTNTPTPTPTVTPICPVAVITNTTWPTGTVRLGCNLGVTNGVTLTILGGTEIVWTGDWRADVRGVLYAVGSAAAPITWTHETEVVSSTWGPLILRGDASTLHYNNLYYGRGLNDWAGSELRFCKVMTHSIGLALLGPGVTDVASSTVQYNGRGLLLYMFAAPLITQCNVLSNTVYDVEMHQPESVVIADCWWGASPPSEAMVWDYGDDFGLGLVVRTDYLTSTVSW